MAPTQDEYFGPEPSSPLPEFLQDPRGVLKRRWPWMVGAFLVGTLASLGVWSSMTPRFYAEATVLIAGQQISERLVAPTIEEDALDRIDSMAVQVLSRERLASLVEEHDLYAELRESETLEEVVARVRGDVTIEQAPSVGPARNVETSRVYVIGFEADRAQTAAAVANALADRFIDVSIESRHRRHRLTSEFLRRQLAAAEQVFQERSREIAEFKREQRGMLPDEVQSNLARLGLLQQQRQSLALLIAEAESRIVALSAGEGTSPDAQLAALRAELRRERSVSTEDHPTVVALRREVEMLEQLLAERVDTAERPSSRTGLLAGAETTIAVLREQLAATERELVELDARVEQMPAVAQQLAGLDENALIFKEEYSELLRKVQDAELSEKLLQAQQGERVSIVSSAVAPTRPMKSRQNYLALALVASIGLAGAAGVALEMLDPVLVTAGQVEAAGEIPVLGSVGRIS